jgi:uridine kinase
MDSFYKVENEFLFKYISNKNFLLKVLTEEQHEQANANNYNFDHPDAFDLDLLLETLKNLKSGKQV